eukprot:SAG25_NODE_738_length_5631_cov_4.919480_1_plen_41_part_10
MRDAVEAIGQGPHSVIAKFPGGGPAPCTAAAMQQPEAARGR